MTNLCFGCIFIYKNFCRKIRRGTGSRAQEQSTCVSLPYIEYNTISDANLVLLCILKCNAIPKWWKYGDKIGITVDLYELESLDGFIVHTEVGVVGI